MRVISFSTIPRISLSGLSIRQVESVRNKIIGLYLKPNEPIRVAPPEGFYGEVNMFGGATPRFQYVLQNKQHTFWLKCPKGKMPYWDYLAEDLIGGDSSRLQPIHYQDKRAEIPRLLVKAYAKHFPFHPTDNYLQNDGDFVA